MTEILVPSRRVPPGRILRRELDCRGWSQKDLAVIMGRPEQAISEIVSGRKRITPQTAVELSQALGTSPQFWMNLDTAFRLWQVHKVEEERDIQRRARLFGLVPLGELVKRGWLPETDDLDRLEGAVCAFLGIGSPEATPRCQISLRGSEQKEAEAVSQLAWVKRVETLAQQQPTARFNRAELHNAVPMILRYAAEAQGLAHVPPMLGSLGVRFVIVPHLPKTFLDGALLRLGHRPVVALTLRYDRIDSFWFTLMHELAHLVAGHRGAFLDTLYGPHAGTAAEEEEANALAQDWLIEPGAYGRFAADARPRYSRQKVEDFAAGAGRHPGIVAGRLQYDGEVAYSHLRALLVRASPYLGEWIDKPVSSR